jgi:hypothetical protein
MEKLLKINSLVDMKDAGKCKLILGLNGHDCVSITPKYKNDSHFHGK